MLSEKRLPVSFRHSSVLMLLCIALLVLPGVGQAQPAAPNGPIHRVIVQVNADFVPEGALPDRAAVMQQRRAISSAQNTVMADLGRSRSTATAARQFTTIPYIALHVDDQGLAALQNNPNVVAIAEDRLYYPVTDSANDVVKASAAWNAGYDGTGQVVAIIDTGIDFGHPAVFDKDVAEACFSNAGFDLNPYSDSACPDETATEIGPGTADPYGFWCWYSNSCHHGTHVAGIAAGYNLGGIPGYGGGVAPGADIIAINVFSWMWDCHCLAAYTSDVIRGLEHVYTLSNTYTNIASVNMSLGGGYYTGVCDWDSIGEVAVVDNLRSAGIAVIAASGNEGQRNAISAPACFSNVISVGATYDSDVVAEFSNHAYFLDFYAPGVYIDSSVLGGGYGTMNGTSMATPYVAGAWTIIRQVFPDATVDDVYEILRSGGHVITGPDGLPYPRLDVFGAFDHIPARSPDQSYNHRQLLDAMQTEAVSTASVIQPILIVFEATQMTIYANADGVHGKVTVNLAVGDDLGGLQFGAVTAADGTAAPASYIETIRAGLPSLLTGAIDRLLDADYPSGHDLDYAFVISTGLKLWVETP